MIRVAVPLLLLAASIFAQDDPWVGSLDREALRGALAAARARLPAAPVDEKAAVNERIALLEQLLTTLGERDSLLGEDEIERRLQSASRELEDMRRRPPEPARVESAKDVQALESLAQSAESAERGKQAELDGLLERRRKAEADLGLLPAREAEAKRRLEAADTNGYLLATRRLEVRVHEEAAAFLRAAVERWRKRLPMQQAELDLARLRAARTRDVLRRARSDLAGKLKAESDRGKEEAAEAARDAERERDPVARFEKRVQAEVRAIVAAAKRDQSERAVLAEKLDAEKSVLARLEDDLERLRARLALGGASERAARLLEFTVRRSRERRLAIQRDVLRRLERQSLAFLEALSEVQDRRWALDLPRDEVAEWKELAGEVGRDRLEDARTVFAESVQGLLAALRDRQENLEEVYRLSGVLERVYADQLRALQRLSSFATSRIYWVRSHPPLTVAAFRDASVEAYRFVAIYGERKVPGGLGRSVAGSPVVWTLVLVGSVAALWLAFFLAGRCRTWRIEMEESRKGRRWRNTLRTVATGLRCALPPAALLLAAALAHLVEMPAEIADPVDRTLPVLAALWFVGNVGRMFLRPGETTEERSRIPPALAAQLLRSLNIVLAGAFFFLLPYRVLSAAPFALVWLPRLCHTAFVGSILLALILLLPRRGALIQVWTGSMGFVYRVWGVVWPLLAVGLTAILAMDLLGYRFGAERLLLAVLQTAGALVILRMLHVLLRGLVEGIASRVRARTAQEEDAAVAAESSRTVLDQLTRVIAVGLFAVALVVLAGVWGLDAQIRDFFSGVRLADLDAGGHLTLWNLLVAALWIAGGHFLVHNLSGLYEFLVFPLVGEAERGGRYVFLALSRYVILLVAYSAALITLHFSFSSIGWLLAAASVGLGFGLQEVVANFVSGLILLVERPVRVGDIITVGDTGGTVERINIRATTVTNWDRQQIIVPNKAFITQNLTNWTRNDEIMRRKIQVGVAYGSDVEKVLRILQEVVDAHPRIVEDPPSRIFFEAFADSSLVFEIWFFTTIVEGRSLMSELRAQIDSRFREAGITIPFPQRDVHVKTPPPPPS